MAGPWEAYQTAAPTSGPWTAYQAAQTPDAGYNAAADTPDNERALVNFGAGIQNLVNSFKQITGLGDQPSDAELLAQRQANQQLKNQDPYVAAGLQLFGQTAPLAALPFVGGPAAGGSAIARTLVAAANGGVGGALAGATEPTLSTESRPQNMAIGGAAGAVLPAAVSVAPSVVSGLANLFTQGGASARAAAKIVGNLGPQDAASALSQIQQYVQAAQAPGASAVAQIPMSAAEITQSPILAGMERQSAAKFAPDWTNLRAAQAQGRYNAFQQATQGAADLPTLTAARDAAADPLRAQALTTAQAAADQAGAAAVVAQGGSVASPAGQQAAADAAQDWLTQPVSGLVQSIMGKFGPSSPSYKVAALVGGDLNAGATPASLYETRKVLLNKLNGPTQIGDDVSAAIKGARSTTMGLVGSIDTALDGASGGAWSKYLAQYSSDSGEVDSATAQQLLRDSYSSPAAPQLAGVPQITGSNLGRALNNYGSNDYGATLDPSTQGLLQDLQGNIGQSEGLQKLMKFTGTSGGGSNTAMDLGALPTLAAQERLTHALPLVGRLFDRSDDLTTAALSDALRNPDVFIAGVSKTLQQNQPLTPSQASILQLFGPASGATAGALTQQAQQQ